MDMENNNSEKVYSLPRIGDPAPQFEATTTQGTIILEDYKEDPG